MPAAIFARLALTEARRGGLVWLALAAIALGLALAGVVILFYLMSIVQWHEHSGH